MNNLCFICGELGTVHLIGLVFACQNHAEGTAAPYTEAAP